MIVRLATSAVVLVAIGFVGGAVVAAWSLRGATSELAVRVAELEGTARRCHDDVVAARATIETYDRWLDRARALRPDAAPPAMGVGGP